MDATVSCPVCSEEYDGLDCAGCGYSVTRCPICGEVVWSVAGTSGEAALICNLNHVVNPCKCMVAFGTDASGEGCEFLDRAFEDYCRARVMAAYADVDDEEFAERSGGRTREDYCRDVDVLRNVLPDVPWMKIAEFKVTDRMPCEIQCCHPLMFFVAPGERRNMEDGGGGR